MIDLVLRSHEYMAEHIGPRANSSTSMVIHVTENELRIEASEEHGAAHPRVSQTLPYIYDLSERARAVHPHARARLKPLVFQANDSPEQICSGSWESQRGWDEIALIPDLYYYQATGYEGFLADPPSWDLREDKLLWRGSTTGILGLTAHRLDELTRYRLCRIAKTLGETVDCGFTLVTQAADANENQAITARLEMEGLARSYIHTHDMARARYAIDIDGNSNSWNFIQRLMLGACMLRVASPWIQWFEDRLIPWQHYVPVAGDLSDLTAKLDWCRSHPIAARDIAHAGRKFACDMSFEGEMERAALTLFPPT